MSSIPKEIQALRQWTYSYSDTDLKRPTHYHYKPDGALSFAQAVEKAGDKRSFGLYVTKEDPYILGDIDHIDDPRNPYPDLPIQLVALLRDKPTYMEVSPSGHGIRFVYKLHDISEKQVVDGFYFKNKVEMGQDSTGAIREAQINIGHPWQRFTGNAIPDSAEIIHTATLADFEDAFNLRHETTKAKDLKNRMVDVSKLPSIEEVLRALQTIPLDQNLRVKRAYENTFMESYTHYSFWLKVLMALHNYAELSDRNVECLDAAIEWSKTDPTDYTGEDTVYKHWRSFSVADDYISYKSLFGIAHAVRLFWPRPKKKKKNETTFSPLITEYVNFLSLMDYYAIRIFRDYNNPHLVYITADYDIIEQYFMVVGVEEHYGRFYGPFSKDTLVPPVYKLCQDSGFTGLNHGQASQFIKTYLVDTKETINLIRYYFDTPFERLPAKYQENADMYDNSTIEYLFGAIEVDYSTLNHEAEEQLYFAYYRAWLMGLVRNMYMNDDIRMNNCILLLTGKEQIRKTSHFKFLLPSFMRQYIAFTTHGFANESSVRDVVKLSSTNLMLVWDEIEQYLDEKTESNFKKIIDNNPQKIIDKYEIVDRVITPIAVYGATSNMRELRLGAEGSRRLFHIPVKWVDTDLINTICWHGLINRLRDEIEFETRKGRVPWLLTEPQLQFQRKLHAKIRTKTTIELLLEEIFDFDTLFECQDGDSMDITSFQKDRTRFFSTKDICEILISKGHVAAAAKRPAVIRSLKRLCSSYTNTEREPINLDMPRVTIKHGEARQGPHKKWVLPAIRKPDPGASFDAYIDKGETSHL